MQIFGLGFKKRGSAAAGCFFYIHVGEKNARAKGNERQHLQKKSYYMHAKLLCKRVVIHTYSHGFTVGYFNARCHVFFFQKNTKFDQVQDKAL